MAKIVAIFFPPKTPPIAYSPEAIQSSAALFEESRKVAEKIHGMMSDFSMAVVDSLLSLRAADTTHSGQILEFVTYKGRSSAVIAPHVRPGEKLILVDVKDYLEVEKIRAIQPDLEFIRCKSEDFPRTYPDYTSIKKRCRFIHVDSSHQYRTTYSEMAMCDALLSPHGIAAFDDFANLDFSQILPAMYKYLYTNRADLAVFLVTREKAYLCRKLDFEYYATFVLHSLIPSMRARGHENLILSRTDWDEEYRAIHLRPRNPGETDNVYGEEIYGHYCKEP